MAANDISPQSPPLNDQVTIVPSFEIELPLRLPELLPQQEMITSPVAPDENNDNFLILFWRLDVKTLNDLATVTQFMRGNVGFVVQEPDVPDDFAQFLILIM